MLPSCSWSFLLLFLFFWVSSASATTAGTAAVARAWRTKMATQSIDNKKQTNSRSNRRDTPLTTTAQLSSTTHSNVDTNIHKNLVGRRWRHALKLQWLRRNRSNANYPHNAQSQSSARDRKQTETTRSNRRVTRRHNKIPWNGSRLVVGQRPNRHSLSAGAVTHNNNNNPVDLRLLLQHNRSLRRRHGTTTSKRNHPALSLSPYWNHPLAGMTNPTLHTTNTQEDKVTGVVDATTKTNGNANWMLPSKTNTSRTTAAQPLQSSIGGKETPPRSDDAASSSVCSRNGWWPRVAYRPPQRTWRTLRLCQRVGFGVDCYEACRDAALAWEFHSGSSSATTGRHQKGIVALGGATENINDENDLGNDPTVSRRQRRLEKSKSGIETASQSAASPSPPVTTLLPLQQHQQLWWGPGQRLATYTSVGVVWPGCCLPSIYTVSPVTVVYNVVDQRGPDSTYTSTAYATGPRHWLRGEERVTVCHRDVNDAVDVEILSFSQAASDTVMGNLVWPVIGRMQRSFFEEQLQSFSHVAHQVAMAQNRSAAAPLLSPAASTAAAIQLSSALVKNRRTGWLDVFAR